MIRDTSTEAYHYIQDSGLISKRRREVYNALFEYGPCTGSELFHKMQIPRGAQSNQNVVTRLGELRDMGVVKEVKERQCSITGMTVIEWDVTSNLPKKYERPKGKKCPHCKGKGKIYDMQMKMEL